MKSRAAVSLILCLASIALAENPPKTREEAQALVSSLHFQKGEVNLSNGLATLHVPPGFQFLNGADANKVVVQLWGNPPSAEPLGLLMTDAGPLSPDSWAVIITYEEDGYVKDQDAAEIKYDELLQSMKKSVQEENPARRKEGYPPMDLVGWAAPPRYDQATHKLYWAKELKFGDEKENTLNYNIRMLGRRGVLVLNAVAVMSQLPEIEGSAPKILSAIDFNPGNRYTDFNPKSGDKVATYGLTALVAGGVAAKLGLFKGLWVALLAAKKFVIIAVVAIAGWFKKLFGKKQPAA